MQWEQLKSKAMGRQRPTSNAGTGAATEAATVVDDRKDREGAERERE